MTITTTTIGQPNSTCTVPFAGSIHRAQSAIMDHAENNGNDPHGLGWLDDNTARSATHTYKIKVA